MLPLHLHITFIGQISYLEKGDSRNLQGKKSIRVDSTFAKTPV